LEIVASVDLPGFINVPLSSSVSSSRSLFSASFRVPITVSAC